MTDIPFNKRYIYDLDPQLVAGMQTLYFDTLTHEKRSKTEFLARRHDEIEVSNDAAVALEAESGPRMTNATQLAQIQRQMEALALQTKNGTQDEELEGVKEDEEIVEESEEEILTGMTTPDSSIDLYQRIESPAPENETPIAESTISFMATKSPQVLFDSPLAPGKALAVYKAVLNAHDSPNFDPLARLSALSARKITKDPLTSGMSAVFMLTSGHFAGAIVSHLPHSTKGNSGNAQTLQLQSVRMLQHKTFHRYTTRRKQGGSQSAMDDAKGKANSAGSTLRRYNEQALEQDIAQLLREWKVFLDECDSIYIRAMGKAGRLLVKQPGENGVLFSDDTRLKPIPFGTGRPTAMEIKKAWLQLAYLQVVDLPSVSTAEINRQKKREEALIKSHAAPKKTEQVASSTETELLALLRKSKAPSFLIYLKKHSVDVDAFRLELPTTPTLLHYAAAHGLSHMVRTLLVQCHANPGVLNDRGKTPYEMAGTYGGEKELVQLEFKLAKAKALGQDWTNAGDFEPMTLEQVEEAKAALKAQKAKQEEAEKKAAQKAMDEAAAKRLEEDRKVQDGRRDARYGKGKSISNTVVQTEEQKLAGLTPEQRMKVMREQRARAIEARMGKLGK